LELLPTLTYAAKTAAAAASVKGKQQATVALKVAHKGTEIACGSIKWKGGAAAPKSMKQETPFRFIKKYYI